MRSFTFDTVAEIKTGIKEIKILSFKRLFFEILEYKHIIYKKQFSTITFPLPLILPYNIHFLINSLIANVNKTRRNVFSWKEILDKLFTAKKRINNLLLLLLHTIYKETNNIFMSCSLINILKKKETNNILCHVH